MAISLNGMIARKNGEEDFLSHENWKSFKKIAEKNKSFIVGRKTYESVMNWKEGYNFLDVNSTRIIISKNNSLKLKKGFIHISSPKNALEYLSKNKIKTAILSGGSKLNSEFMKQNLVDEILINIEPYILGKGITLFFPKEFENKLKLIETKKLTNQIIQLHYKVIK